MDVSFAQTFGAAANPILLADDERRYVDANDAAVQLIGYTREELLGLRIEDITPPAQRDGLEEMWADFLRRGGLTGTFTLLTAQGREIQVAYGAVANVAPGRHLSILLPIDDDGQTGDARPVLTPREREVLALVAGGATTRAVAEELILSPTTVESHIRSAIERLGARNRAHAVALALARGEVQVAA